MENTNLQNKSESGWEPRIIAFVCNWCTYSGADLAGTSRLKYSPNVRVIKFPCTGRMDYNLIIKALERGADGVLVSGCHPGDCHYKAGNYHARRRFTMFRELLKFTGVNLNRVQFCWISAAEGAKWKDTINTFTQQIKDVGPFHTYQEMIKKS